MAYRLIIVTVVQRDLQIVSDEVLEYKVELPSCSRGEEGKKYKGKTQDCSPKHGCTVGTMWKNLIALLTEPTATHPRVFTDIKAGHK